MADDRRDDEVRHGLDDNPSGDAEKGAALGGVGGAVTGGIAGAAAGPIGAVTGAVIGGVVGAVASGLGVAAVDRVDNDDTITGIGGKSFEEDEDHYRSDYQTRYASSGNGYETYQPAYRYGHSLNQNEQFRGREWDSIENDVRTDYETLNPGGRYDDHRDAIRTGYERTRLSSASGSGSYAYADDSSTSTNQGETGRTETLDDNSGNRHSY